MRDPKPYQIPAIQFAMMRNCVGLFLEKRLGKSMVAIRWAISTGAKHILIVAPLSAIPDWMNELKADDQYATNCTHPGDLESYMRLRDSAISREFAITNSQALFTSAQRSDHGVPCPKPIALLQWDAVILDESTTCKGSSSQVTKIMHSCFGKVQYKAALSGEYAPEGPEDIFEQMNWLLGGFMGFRKFWPWRDHYFQQVAGGFKWYPKRGASEAIKAAVLKDAYILSRKDAGVREERTIEVRKVQMGRKFRTLYNRAEKFYEIPLQLCKICGSTGLTGDGVGNEFPCMVCSVEDANAQSLVLTKYAPVLHTWLAQLSGGYPGHFPELRSTHKMDALVDLITGELADQKVVVSFAFNAELHAAEDALQARGVSCVTVSGEMSKPARSVFLGKFQKGEVRVFLKQAKIHFGMDLAIANVMIRYSLPQSYTDISQDRDRIVNPARKAGIVLRYIDLITENTVDEDAADAAGQKGIVARMFAQNVEARFEARRKRNSYAKN